LFLIIYNFTQGLKNEYEQLKQEQKKIYVNAQRMKLEINFQVKLRENERNFEIWPKLMTEIISTFDELTFAIYDGRVAAQREQLEKVHYLYTSLCVILLLYIEFFH
jgi:hypothetical protein